jgi:hypothetical protein
MQNYNSTTETPKLKIKTTISEEFEKEIDLPYYCKFSDDHFLKVESDRKAITVQTYHFAYSIRVDDIPNYSIIAQSEECSKEEFNTAFETVLTKLQNVSL